MKIRLILNPASGRLRRSPEIARLVQEFVARRPGVAELLTTTHAGHATELAAAAAAAGTAIVVAVGGDGTMNEVARALVGQPTALGLVPCGSGNGLARHLGLPLRPAAALAALETGRPRVIDHGRVNDRPFFCTAGTGFEARIAEVFNRGGRRGLLGYLQAGLREYWRYRAVEFAVTADGGPIRNIRAFTLAVANAGQYGNNARIAPGARIDDGRLDLVAVPALTAWNAPRLAWRLFGGDLRRESTVTMLSAAALEITSGQPLPFHVDGESHPPTRRLSVTVVPRSLRVIAPAPAG